MRAEGETCAPRAGCPAQAPIFCEAGAGQPALGYPDSAKPERESPPAANPLDQTEKLDPHPQVVVAFGFLITNCAPSRPSW